MTSNNSRVGSTATFLQALQFGAMVSGGDIPPAWSPDGRAFAVLTHDPALSGLVVHDLAQGPRSVIGLAELCDVLGAAPDRLTGVSITWREKGSIQLDHGTRRIVVETTSGGTWPEPAADQARRTLTEPRVVRPPLITSRPPIMELLAPDSSWLATERDGDLWLRRPGDAGERRLTRDGGPELAWEIEFGAWSADSRALLAMQVDYSGVPTVPVVTWTEVHEQVALHPYPRPGDRFPRTTAHVFDVRSGQSVALDLGEDELFWIQPAGRTHDGDLLLLTSGRFNSTLTLHAVDMSTGDARVVVEERSDTFVYGIRLGQFATNGWPVPQRPELIWMSERDGHRQAYRYGVDGTLLAQLTCGPFDVDRVLGRTADGTVFLLAHSDVSRPYDVHICRVHEDGSGFQQLTIDSGVHTGWLAPDGRHLLNAHSSLTRPPRTDLITSNGELISTAALADVGPAMALGWSPPEEFRCQAIDGITELQGVLLHPPGFDPQRRYPLVEVIYGGPQEIVQPRDFRQTANPLAFALSQLGFVVLVVDGPGTPGRGKAFQDVVFGRFGQQEIAEHAAVVHHVLSERPYLDPARVGIVGGSWGGYMVLRALATAAETYHVGACLYGVGDVYDHMARAIEPYLGSLESNADAYAAADVLSQLENVRGKLLVLHGTADVNAPFSACMKIVDALVAADKDFDLVVLPGMQHAFIGPGALYGLRRTAEFLVRHLVPSSD